MNRHVSPMERPNLGALGPPIPPQTLKFAGQANTAQIPPGTSGAVDEIRRPGCELHWHRIRSVWGPVPCDPVIGRLKRRSRNSELTEPNIVNGTGSIWPSPTKNEAAKTSHRWSGPKRGRKSTLKGLAELWADLEDLANTSAEKHSEASG